MGVDESSQPTSVQLNVGSLPPSAAIVPRGRVGPADGRGTAAATSLRAATMEEVQSVSVQDSALCGNDRGQRVWGNCQPPRVSSIAVRGF